MEIYIFLLCYNESVLLPHTIAHYRAYMPNCNIIIYDNMSTDNSVAIATSLGCHIIEFKSNGRMDDYIHCKIKNTCWNNIKNGWIICADMDEWLCITDDELYNEYLHGTTILKTKGINMAGNSNNLLLDDINLHSLNKGVYCNMFSKSCCFLASEIKSVKYSIGAHTAIFTGNIKYSKTKYINKHMDFLGLPYYLNKKKNRNHRASILNFNKKNFMTNFNNFGLKYVFWYSSSAEYHKFRFLSFIKESKPILEINLINNKIIEDFMEMLITALNINV